MNRSRITVPTSRRNPFLFLGLFGLGGLLPGCGSQEGIIELKKPAASAEPAANPDTANPSRGPKRAGAGAPGNKKAAP